MNEIIQVSKVERLHDQGLSNQAISRVMGYSSSWARQQLRALGINSPHDYSYFTPIEEQRDLLVGTVLGDGSLNSRRKNARLTLDHGSVHFRERIEPYIPESMLFKFNRHLRS